MRTHSEIIREYGATKLVRALQERGIVIHQSTPQRWADRGSIPAEYWTALVDLGASTLEEMSEGAAQRIPSAGAPSRGEVAA